MRYERGTRTEFGETTILSPGMSMGTPTDGIVSIGPFEDVTVHGAKGDGTTDDSTAFAKWITALEVAGGIGIIPPGTYLLATEQILQGASQPIEIIGFGAVIKTSGAIAGFTVKDKTSTTAPVVIRGLKIDHRNNSSATYGFNVEGGWNVRLIDCTVVADDVSASYAAFRLAMSDATDGGTGSFWSVIERPWVRKESGGDGTDIPIAILIEGNPNASRIIGGGLNNCTTAILIRDQSSGDGRIANGLVIDGVAIEGFGTGIHVTSGTATAVIGGLRFINNRFEAGTTAFSFTGITTQPAVQPWLEGNFLVSDVTNYLNNPNNLRINLFDFSTTPNIGRPELWRGIDIHGQDGTDSPLNIRPGGGARGIFVQRPSDNANVARLVWTGVAVPSGRIGGRTNNELAIQGVIGIGGDGTNDALQLRGQVTISDTSTTAGVTFGTAEANVTYFIAAIVTATSGTPATGSTRIHITAKATTGFTVNVEVAPGTSNSVTIDWIMVR